MDTRELERVLLDQKEELEALRNKSFCHRLEESQIDLNSNLAQVVIGVRRSGKSTLCFNALEKSKVRYAYVNLDDENLYGLTVKDMNDILQVLYSIYGNFTHLFLDEIQNIKGWHLFVNRMLRKGMHVLLTGSNSKLLSGELASHLTGRHHTIELLPFSFRDWCNYNGIATAPLTTKNMGILMGAFDKYLRQGGFPELLIERNHTSYIDSLFHNIITQDIQKRFNVKYIDSLERLAGHLLNISPTIIVKDKLQEQFGFKSHHTLGNYLSYLAQTYLICKVSKYSTKSRERSVAEKAYAIDVAFMNKRENALAGENLGWRLETIVYLELRRRIRTEEEDIYYFDNGNTEADFIVCNGNKATGVYQVSYNIENPKTRRREVNGAITAAKTTKCNDVYILTDHQSETIVQNGIKIKAMPVWEWIVREG
jgi:predicted AAA+ superfamily ATPase